MRAKYDRLLSLLGQGELNAKSAQELSNILGIDTRTIRFMVNTARREGELICSGPSGYWRPGNRLELMDTYRRLSTKALSLLKALAHARQRLGVVDGQIDLVFDDDERVKYGDGRKAE